MASNKSTKQAILFTVINYLGVLIGVVSTVLIYPLDKELLGIIRFVDAFAQVIFPVIVLGSTHALINFYPTLDAYFQRKLFSFSLLALAKMSAIIGFVVLVCYWFVSKENYWFIYSGFFLAIAMAYIDLFRRQATNLDRLAYVTFFEKIIPKIALPVVFMLIIYHKATISIGIWLYIGAYYVIVLVIARYIFNYFKFSWHSTYTDLFEVIGKKQYYWYSFFAFAGSFGQFFAFRVDSLMIPTFLGFEQNGTYNIGVTLASTLAIPATGVFALYAPLVSNYIKNGFLKQLNIQYKQTARILFFIGMVLYSCVVVGMEPFFRILPTFDKLQGSLPVIYILGFNVVINMSTGFNNEIISYSKYYRYNLRFICALMVVNVGLNYCFLSFTNLGIVGVAIASLFSMSLFNLVKTVFIYRKMRLWPFDIVFLKLCLAMFFILVVVYFIPNFISNYYTLLGKVSLVLLAAIVIVFYTTLVMPIRTYLLSKLKKIK
ncbi:lipopolysaccharide biosynthesis protein [Myroides sp. LJL119]